MCFHTRQSKKAQELTKRFNAMIDDKELFEEIMQYNAFTYPQTPVIIDKEPKIIKQYNWGLIPEWAKNNAIRQYTLNAKAETLSEKQSFRNSINNRCLVIADGFYEWQWLNKSGTQKQKYIISKPNNELFAFAGIYSNWEDKSSGNIFHTYSILTTQANAMMSEIHNSKKRMPVILKNEDELSYLTGKNISEIQYPYEVEMVCEKIGNDIFANPLNNDLFFNFEPS